MDYDEVRALYAEGGWTQKALAGHFGVSLHPIRCALNERTRQYHRDQQIAYRVPCANGCGRLVHGRYAPDRVCVTCNAERRQQHGWSRYKRGGCRCDVCRAAAAAQKRRQRANNIEHYREYWRNRAARR